MKQKDFYNSLAWKYCSRYILLYYSDENYVVQCSTSGKYYQLPDKRIHAGHYIPVHQFKATAFEFKNILPQSYQDNKFYSGKPEIMANKIDKIHGTGTVEMLNIKKHNICKLGKFEMDYFAKYYKQKFEELVKIKGNPWNN